MTSRAPSTETMMERDGVLFSELMADAGENNEIKLIKVGSSRTMRSSTMEMGRLPRYG